MPDYTTRVKYYEKIEPCLTIALEQLSMADDHIVPSSLVI